MIIKPVPYINMVLSLLMQEEKQCCVNSTKPKVLASMVGGESFFGLRGRGRGHETRGSHSSSGGRGSLCLGQSSKVCSHCGR